MNVRIHVAQVAFFALGTLLLAGCPPAMVLMQQAAPVPEGEVQVVTGVAGVGLRTVQQDDTGQDVVKTVIIPDIEQGIRVGLAEWADFGVRLSIPTFLLLADVNIRIFDTEWVDLLIDPAISFWAPALLTGDAAVGNFGVLHGYLPVTLAIRMGAHNLLLSARVVGWAIQVNGSGAGVALLGGVAAVDFNVSGIHIVPEVGYSCVPGDTFDVFCIGHVAVGFGYGTD